MRGGTDAGMVDGAGAEGPDLLVRPDGYVAWAGRSADGGWAGALATWTAASVPVRVTSS